jgi:hypothetical protein
MLEAALFPRKLASPFFLYFCRYYIFCWIRVQIRFRNGNRNDLRVRFCQGKKLWSRFRLRFYNTVT